MVDPPFLSSPSLKSRLSSLKVEPLENLKSLTDEQKSSSVIIVQDPLTSLYEAELVCDHVELFQKLGLKVFVLPYMENGKAMHVKGFLDDFKKVVTKTNETLNHYAQYGVSYVTIEPAVALTYREEYAKYAGEQNYRVHMIQEFLAQRLASSEISSDKLDTAYLGESKVALFGHCGEKTSSPAYAKHWKSVFKGFGLELGVQQVGCCGMAGVYGHEKEHKESSLEIYEIHWAEKIRHVSSENIKPLVTGASCRSQVKRIEKQKPVHPVTFLNGGIRF